MNAGVMTLGRFLLVLYFLIDGVTKAMDVGGTAQVIASEGFPQPQLLTALAIVVEVGGSLLLIFNRFTVPASLALAAFCFATGFVFHNFWVEVDAVRFASEFNHFMKYIALAGAFLTIAAMPSIETIPVLRHRVGQLERQSPPAGA
jgi:putative oxidoreductase